MLKSDSHLTKHFVLFASMKDAFYLSQRLFWFSRYLTLCLDFSHDEKTARLERIQNLYLDFCIFFSSSFFHCQPLPEK